MKGSLVMRRILLLLFVSAVAANADAQSTLTGAVRTKDGLGVPQLVVTASAGGRSSRATTGPEGRYRLEGLAPGEYQVTVEAPGFVQATDARLSMSGDTRKDLVLEPAPVREQVVVTATRGEAAQSSLGVSVTAFDAERIAEREPSSFIDVLRDAPGTAVARNGAIGHIASSFVRGGESNAALVLIDGIPANEPGGAYNYGSQFPLELSRVEVLRGAASSLYGTDALAGAIQLVTRRAAAGERPSASAEAEGGDFGFFRGRGATAGRGGAFDWNVGLLYLETDNQQPNSRFEQGALAAALGVQLSAATSLRALLRGETSSVGAPGPTAYGRPDLDASSEHDERVASLALVHARDAVRHELRAGWAATDQLSLNPLDSGSYVPADGARRAPFASSDFTNDQGYQNDTARLLGAYQIQAALGGAHLLTAGADVERETGEIGDRRGALLSPERVNFGGYLQDRIALGRLSVTAGLRVESNDSYGTRAVPRAAVAWRLGPASRTTTLRASGGAGIKEPSFLQSFGVSSFALGNPDLLPERSRTFDLGVEQRLARDRVRLAATAFHHDYRDQIAYTVLSLSPFTGSYENLGRTRGRGLELELDAAPVRGLLLGAQYTLLDGEIVDSVSANPLYAVGQPLLRRPRHQGSFWGSFGKSRLSGGLSLLLVGERADSDFLGIGLTENEAYTRLDARLRCGLWRRLELFAVAENLLDAEYQEVLGYPALGRSFRLGLRLRSGATQ
jgi:outer membrane cobalamin receptor